jgi:hypothetical protein
MADISIEVPGHHVRRVVVSLLHELAPVAESIYVRANACIGGDDDAENLRGDLAELRDVEDVLDDLGWSLAEGQVARSVTGHPVLLGDVVYGALTGQVEDLRAALRPPSAPWCMCVPRFRCWSLRSR